MNTIRLLLCAMFIAVLAPSSAVAESGTGGPLAPPSFELTPEERDFAKSALPLKVSYSSAWQPFEYKRKDGSFAGIMADIFAKVSERTGLRFIFVPTDTPGGIDYEADIVSSFEGNKDIAAAMGYRLTKPYLSMPMLIVKEPSLSPAVAEEPVKTAVPSSFYSYIQLNKSHRDFNCVPYNSAQECLDAVMTNEVEQALLNLVFIEHVKQKLKYRDLLSVNLQGVTYNSCIAVRHSADPRLLSILDKALAGIPISEINGIVAKNTIEMQVLNLSSIIEAMPSDVALILSAFLLVLVVVMLFLIRNRTMHIREIKRILYTDELTGALSLAGFENAVRQMLSVNSSAKYYITSFDICRFENYNVQHGVSNGDKLLRLVAKLLQSEDMGTVKKLARIFADHFVTLSECRSTEVLVERTKWFDSRIRAMAEANTSILISYGIYEINDASMSVREMMDCAEMAKKQVKGNATNFIGIYDQNLRDRRNEDGAMLAGMDAAIKNGEFVAYYQPKYSCDTQDIISAEALVRWMRNGSMVSPDRFIGLFEGNGQISRLDFYMLEQVCKMQMEFANKGLPLLSISVNFSRVHLYDPSFVDELVSVTKRYNVPPHLIEAEFTEGAMVDNLNDMRACIARLRDAGFSVAMDDFGSGYSSLNALKELPIDVVKLDKGFMNYEQASSKESGRKVVKSVIDLAKQLSLKTVAEGVETKEQFEFLRDCGCDMIQGYYFSKPVDAATYEKLLSAQRRG